MGSGKMRRMLGLRRGPNVSVEDVGLYDCMNVTLDREGLLRPREALAQVEALSAPGGTVSAMHMGAPFVACADGVVRRADTGASVSGTVTSPTDMVDLGGSLFVAQAGPTMRCDDMALQVSGLPRPCPIVDVTTGVSATPEHNWLPAGASCSFRYVLTRRLPSGRIVTSAPSARRIVRNSSVDAWQTKPWIDLGLTDGVLAGDAVQVYRTASNPTGADPGDEHYLVYERTVRAGEEGSTFVVQDYTDDVLLGTSLYTNPSQETALSENSPTPTATRLAVYRDCLFLGGGSALPRAFLQIVGMPETSDMLTVRRSDGASATVFATSAIPGGFDTFSIYTAGTVDQNIANTAQDLARALNNVLDAAGFPLRAHPASSADDMPGKLLLEGTSDFPAGETFTILCSRPERLSPQPQWTERAGARERLTANTVRVTILNDLSTTIEVGDSITFPTATADFPAGTFTVLARSDAGVVPGNIEYQDNAGGVPGTVEGASLMPLTRAGDVVGLDVTWDAQAGGSRVWFSKALQPDHVPFTNALDVGSAQPILALVPTRDSLFIFKADGLYRLYGATPADFRVETFDPELFLAGDYSACFGDGAVFALTTRGAVRVTESGVSIIGKDVEPLLAAHCAAGGAFVIQGAFEPVTSTYRLLTYALDEEGVPSGGYASFTGATGSETEVFVFSAYTREWTQHSVRARGVLSDETGGLWWFCQEGTVVRSDAHAKPGPDNISLAVTGVDGNILSVSGHGALQDIDHTSIPITYNGVTAYPVGYGYDAPKTLIMDRSMGSSAAFELVELAPEPVMTVRWNQVDGDADEMQKFWREVHALVQDARQPSSVSLQFAADEQETFLSTSLAATPAWAPGGSGTVQRSTYRFIVPQDFRRRGSAFLRLSWVGRMALRGISCVFRPYSHRSRA